MPYAAAIGKVSFGGLRPKARLCVGPGFVREDLKALLLARGEAFIQGAVVRLEDLCREILKNRKAIVLGDRDLLGALGRQEVLRTLLAERKVNRVMPELKRLRRQSGFFKKLDRAIQAGRLSAAHADEEQVFHERLTARLGANPVREEIRMLARAYEAMLEGLGVWDLPRLYRETIGALEEGGPGFDTEIYFFTAQKPEALEAELWAALGRSLRIHRIGPVDDETQGSADAVEWERWHTLDDAAEELAALFTAKIEAGEDLAACAVLIPDEPGVRRTLTRAFAEGGVPLADPRDPTRLRWDEELKAALLPLELVARRFERPQVISYLQMQGADREFPEWVREINSRGIRNGKAAYRGGSLEPVHELLLKLEVRFGAKMTASELAEAHLEYLRGKGGSWLLSFFEATWSDFCADMNRLAGAKRRAPALYWLERLKARLEESAPPAERLRPLQGVHLYRLSQAPLQKLSELYVFGLPAGWLSGQSVGDYWYSERDREILASEFGVRSVLQVHEERLACLRAWMRATGRVSFLDAEYDSDGRERETIRPALRELGVESPEEPSERGAHPRWMQSLSALRLLQPQDVRLAGLFERSGRREIRATEIDSYSRCAFRGLASGRWQLWDAREPGAELWPEVKGNILHYAIRLMLENGTPRREALEQAWATLRPKGMLRGERLAAYVKSRLEEILRVFEEKDREYRARSGVKIRHLEGPELRIEYPDFSIVGIPDRVDEHPEGHFILDYKTSSSLPSGRDMVELGYRLQLPFYALASQRQLEKKSLGVQFVELSRKGGRTRGIFPKRLNGKTAGNLTSTQARASLFEDEPDAIWSQCEETICREAGNYVAGAFPVRPKKEKQDCPSCPFGDLCGKRRRTTDAADEGASDG